MMACAWASELGHVQTFVSQATIEQFDEGVPHRFAGPNEVELQAPPIGPIFECLRLEFGPVIHP